jgi:peptide/nickel transport system permease protein
MGAGCGNAVRGNFGFSFTYKIETFELIKQRLYYTFILSFWATVFAWVVGIPLGIYVARNRNKFGDRVANFVAFAGISCRAFSSRSLAMKLAQTTGWFPVGGAQSVNYESLSQFEKIKGHRLAHDFARCWCWARAAWPA